MRMEFSKLRDLQKKFFWRLSEDSAVNLFKVIIFFIISLYSLSIF